MTSSLSRTRIKFCGITCAEDAVRAVVLGVDALGFVQVPASKRFISLERAVAIRAQLPPFVMVVALLSDANADFVRQVIAALDPDLLQFHGTEPAEFCDSFDYPYLKAVAMATPQNLEVCARKYPNARGLLLDSHAPGGLGGTGRIFDWAQLPHAPPKPLILAGGLNAANVAKAITMARPYAVDVSSGIESAPGIKDHEQMRAFVAAVRRADQELMTN
jgi:phosphoribosylanthranilate isomerase